LHWIYAGNLNRGRIRSPALLTVGALGIGDFSGYTPVLDFTLMRACHLGL